MKHDLKILVIDDSKTSRKLLRTYACATDFKVEMAEADDGRTGLRLLAEDHYDCVFLDYILPDLDGLQVLRQIKLGGMDIPVIVLTGQGSEPLAVEMMKAGADDYVPKCDLTPDVLYRCLRNAQQLAEVRKDFREANANMVIAQNEAAQAHRAQSEFFTRMSHEIRTPLNVILGTTDLLKQTQLTHEQHGLVETCERASSMLMVLINDILDLSKVQSGELELKSVAFNLRNSFINTCKMMAVQAKGKGLVFQHEFGPELPEMVVGDSDRLTQILVNLTGNAIKFTRQGSVRVIAEVDPDRPAPGAVRFRVEDTGIGIPADKQEIIFTSFNQADRSVSHEYGGTGLGLAITKTLVEKMHGHVRVESEVGKGSIFQVTVLFGLPEKAASPLAEDSVPEPMRPPPVSKPHARILVAEDTFDNRLLIKSFLKRAPVEVEFAFNGRDACTRFLEGHFDVILMDMEMPEMNGFEAAARIREMERAAGKSANEFIPIIALTAHSFVEEKNRCFEAGCSDFLMKPFKRGTLLDKLREHVGSLPES